MKRLILVAVVTVAIFAACGQAGPTPETGRLSLSLGEQMESLSTVVGPPTPMEIAGYRILITQNSVTYFDQVLVPQGSIDIELPPGTNYSVLVEGQNNADPPVVIASGEETGVVVSANQTTSVAVTVSEFTGDGYLDLLLTWEAEDVAQPVDIESELRRASDDYTLQDASQTWVSHGGEGWARFDDQFRISNGWWMLTFRLYSNGDSENAVAGEVFLVRIVRGMTTEGVFELLPNELTGELEIVIAEDMYAVLEMDGSLENGEHDIVAGESQMITVSSPNDPDVRYVWFVQGSQVAEGATFTYEADGQVGDVSRVSVVGYTADGKLANAISYQFNLVAPE